MIPQKQVCLSSRRVKADNKTFKTCRILLVFLVEKTEITKNIKAVDKKTKTPSRSTIPIAGYALGRRFALLIGLYTGGTHEHLQQAPFVQSQLRVIFLGRVALL